jgi:hypothetical protein
MSSSTNITEKRQPIQPDIMSNLSPRASFAGKWQILERIDGYGEKIRIKKQKTDEYGSQSQVKVEIIGGAQDSHDLCDHWDCSGCCWILCLTLERRYSLSTPMVKDSPPGSNAGNR